MLCTDIINKRRLEKYRSRVKSIKDIEVLIEAARAKQSPKSSRLSDMPRAQTIPDPNRISDDIVDLEKKKEKIEKINTEERIKIDLILEKMLELPENPKGPTNINLYYLIKCNYLNCDSWKTIAEKFFPGDDENLDSNITKLHKWNGQALAKFLKCQEK